MHTWSSAGGIAVPFGAEEPFVDRRQGMHTWSSVGRIAVLFGAEEMQSRREGERKEKEEKERRTSQKKFNNPSTGWGTTKRKLF